MNTVPASAPKPNIAPDISTALIAAAFVAILVVLMSFVQVLRDHVQRGKTWREDFRLSKVDHRSATVAGASLATRPRALNLAEASAASDR